MIDQKILEQFIWKEPTIISMIYSIDRAYCFDFCKRNVWFAKHLKEMTFSFGCELIEHQPLAIYYIEKIPTVSDDDRDNYIQLAVDTAMSKGTMDKLNDKCWDDSTCHDKIIMCLMGNYLPEINRQTKPKKKTPKQDNRRLVIICGSLMYGLWVGLNAYSLWSSFSK